MSYLLDTDISAAIIRDDPLVSHRRTQTAARLYLSAISITELEMWLLRSRTPLRYRQKFFNFQYSVTLLDVNEPIAHRAAMIDRRIRDQGRTIGLADALIAATAVEHGLTLVTHSTPRFANIPGLTVLDWSVP